MSSKRPPDPHATQKVNAAEVRRLAEASVPCAGCTEMLPQLESLRRFLVDERRQRALLEALLRTTVAQLDELRGELHEKLP